MYINIEPTPDKNKMISHTLLTLLLLMNIPVNQGPNAKPIFLIIGKTELNLPL